MSRQGLIVENLTLSYNPSLPLLANAYLHFESNGIYGIIGRNGAGKTTLFKALTVDRTSEYGLFFNDKWIAPKMRYSLIGYLSQNSMFPSELTVLGCLNFWKTELQEVHSTLIQERVRRILHSKLGMLSGGERRLVELICILQLDRKIYILDEPLSEIEPIYESEICSLLREKAKEKIIILTDHRFQSLIDTCDKLFLLRNGAIQRIDGPIVASLIGYAEQAYSH